MPDPLPTLGSRYSRDKTGVRSVELIFSIEGPAENDGAEPWELIDAFAPAFPEGVVETGVRSAAKQDDGSWLLSITGEGLAAGTADGTGTIEYDNAGVEDPIESFAQFDLLKAKYSGTLVNGQVEWKEKITLGGAANVNNPMLGTTHFLNNQPILRITKSHREFPQDALRNICKIAEPDLPANVNQVVPRPDGKLWLKTSVKLNFRGNAWQAVTELKLGKWVPEIYNAKG